MAATTKKPVATSVTSPIVASGDGSSSSSGLISSLPIVGPATENLPVVGSGGLLPAVVGAVTGSLPAVGGLVNGLTDNVGKIVGDVTKLAGDLLSGLPLGGLPGNAR